MTESQHKRKKLSQKRYEELYIEEQLKKHPSRTKEWMQRYFPYVKPKKTKANLLTEMIINWITWHGYQAERVSSMGRVIGSKRVVKAGLFHAKVVDTSTYIPGNSKKGTADIAATIIGRSVKIEVKIGADRQSKEQKAYQMEVERAGGIYLIAKDFESFVDWWDGFIAQF